MAEYTAIDTSQLQPGGQFSDVSLSEPHPGAPPAPPAGSAVVDVSSATGVDVHHASPPPTGGDQHLTFVDIPAGPDAATVAPAAAASGGNITGSIPQNGGVRRRPGATKTYLKSKGFGWLMELDEEEDEDLPPLLEELDIDLKDIYYKVRCVLLPLPVLGFQRAVVRDNPDFWGPLFIVVLYALISLFGQLSVVSWIITIWVCGSVGIFLLSRVLGANATFSQTLGVIGYSVLPLILVGFLLPLVQHVEIIALLIQGLGVFWAAYSAGTLLATEELQSKKSLLLYPIFLLYVYFISLHSGV